MDRFDYYYFKIILKPNHNVHSHSFRVFQQPCAVVFSVTLRLDMTSCSGAYFL